MLAALVVVAGLTWAAGLFMTWFTWHLATNLPDRDGLGRIGDMAQATTIYDAHDTAAFTVFKEQRIEVPLSRMSPHLVRAILSVEDQRFYEHRGIDVVRVLGAVAANLRKQRVAQGGSTITQQLARQSFLTTDKTLRRKLTEVMLATQLERSYSKDDILQMYLNKVYFGDGLYGVEAAALGFFGKHASELALPEAALLAGLVKSPSTYAPTVSLDRAVSRRNVVLQTMVDSGAITREQAEEARSAEVKLHDALRRDEPYGLYFKEHVRRALVERFGWERVYQGGLRVYTTLDLPLQKAAEQLVADSLEEIEKLRARAAERRRKARKKGEPDAPPAPAEPPLQAALVALDPETGDVRVMVGGRSFEKSRFNRAVQARRQPGSAFKPFVFAAAIESGYTPASLIEHLDEPVMTLQGEWVPEDEHSSVPAMTLRTALRTSSNRAAVRLLEEVGIDKTVAYAKQLGVGSVPSVPSLALGSGEVTLLSMTAAYAAFANRGLLAAPTFIRRVEDLDGQVLFESKPESARVLSETTAFLLTSMLADVVNQGTAWRARREGFMLPAAGKTGTTNDYVDAWFVGFTPSVVTGVWVGFDQPQTIVPNGYAGDIAVPLWARFMKAATKGDKPEWFSPPKGLIGVNVCRLSGLLPNKGCSGVEVVNNSGEVQTRSMVYTDYFQRGKQPLTICPLHEGVSFFDRVAGLFGKDEGLPASAEQLGLPADGNRQAPAALPTSGTASTPKAEARNGDEKDQAEPSKKKKRGFWARVFGVGKDDDKKEKDRKNEENDDPQR
jgi:penicillin-binding protein 1A